MDFKEEIYRIKDALKGVLLGIVIFAVYWYIGIYLFKKNLIINNPPYIPIIFSIGLSMSFCVVAFYIGSVIAGMIDPDDKSIDPDGTKFFQGIMIIGYVINSVVISITTVVCYYRALPFKTYLIFTFGLGTIFPWLILGLAKLSVKGKKQAT